MLIRLYLLLLALFLVGCAPKPMGGPPPDPAAIRASQAKQAQMRQEQVAQIEQGAPDPEVALDTLLDHARLLHKREFRKSLVYEVKPLEETVLFQLVIPEGRKVENNRKRAKLRIIGEAFEGSRHLLPVVLARGWKAQLEIVVAGAVVEKGQWTVQQLKESAPDFQLKPSQPLPLPIAKGSYEKLEGSWIQIEIRSQP